MYKTRWRSISLKIDSWPLWLQVIVVLPHAATVMGLLIWNPKTTKQWIYGLLASAYLFGFYWIFIRQ